VADIPLDDADAFDAWLRARFHEKDRLMEEYLATGRFPPLPGAKKDYVETAVRTKYPFEFLQIFAVLLGLWLAKAVLARMWVGLTTPGW
jgi:lysocardiolipin and lysophospholipid acyltransferase